MTNKKTQSGFTLIEILIVVAIVGLLAAVILTALGRTRSKGRDTKRKSELVQLQKALELYYNQNNAYPCTGGTAAAPTCTAPYVWRAVAGSCPAGGVSTSGTSGYIPDVAPTYLLALPTDPKPSTANCSGYAYRSDGTNYKLNSSSITTLGNGGPELTIDVADSFYDVCRPGLAYTISNKPSVTNVLANCATPW
jgi:prepilin-type N-terminal cleavage/methylation domain-containing protein